MQSSETLPLPLGILVVIVTALRGICLVRGGKIRKDTLEYKNAVGLVNLVNMLRRRPLQEDLTDAQMRAIGVYYLVGALSPLILWLLVQIIWYIRGT